MQHSSDELISAFLKKNSNKSEQDISKLMKTLFESPNMLLTHIKALQSPHTRSNLDVNKLFELYSNISTMKKDNDLLILYNKTFNELVSEITFKNFLKSTQQLKYFLIVILWDKLFTVKHFQFVTLRVLEYIQRANYYEQIFTEWLSDFPSQYMRVIIQSLHTMLQIHCNTLAQNPQTQQSNRELAKKIHLICHFLNLLFKSNKINPRIHIKQFNSEFLTKFFQPVQQFKIYLSKSSDFNFVNYPFLLDFDYKYKLMQIESIYEQKMSIKKNMERGLSALIQDFDVGGNFGIQGLIYLCFAIHRSNILDDSMEKLNKIKQNLKSPLRIQFIGEEGTDQGGVKNEYFSLITKSIFNPYLDMFLPKNSGRFYWFNGFSYEMPVRFEFVGMLLGLSLYNSVHLDIHFPLVAYKKLLNKKYEEDQGLQIVEDLKEIEPDIYRSLKDILTTTEPLDQLQLYFNIQLQSFGETIIQELVEEGSQIKVSLDNRQEYCLLYADYLLNKHILKQFLPFRKGFYKVVSGGIIQTLEPQQLRMLIGGKQEINIKQLEESTTYEGGYSRQTPIIRHLWDFLYTLSEEQRKSFLTFITGTDRVPIEGLKSLKFNIQRHSNVINLPTAHTCFNVLLLPEYESKEILEKSMRLILQHNQGFGLI